MNPGEHVTPRSTRFHVGKLPAAELQRLLGTLPKHDSRVILGPKIGEDAAVLDTGDRYLVVSTDPVTFVVDRIGWYAVHVNANDVAVMGASPRWFFAVLLLPGSTTDHSLVESIMTDVETTCATLGITVCGGHTEITAGLDRPIVVGQMLGEVEKPKLVDKTRLRVGDRIMLTHGVAIEGTAILAREKADKLHGRVPAGTIDRASAFLFDPGLSVVAAALAACAAGDVHAMHDPTEGGLVSGLIELMAPSRLGLLADAGKIRILPETAAICDALGLDPLRLIASGALLIGASPADSSRIASALEARQIPVSTIGEVRETSEGVRMEQNGRSFDLSMPERDEIARIFDE